MGLKAVGHSDWFGVTRNGAYFRSRLDWFRVTRIRIPYYPDFFFFWIMRFSKSVLVFFRIPLRTALVSSNLAKQIKSQRWLVTSLRLTFKVHRPKNLRYCAELQKLSAVDRTDTVEGYHTYYYELDLIILAMQRCGFGIQSSGWLVAGTGRY